MLIRTNIIFNIALKTLKAIPSAHANAYEFERGRTFLHPEYKSTIIVGCFQKLRILTLVFRRRQFKHALKTQCKALGLDYRSIPLDMPVRWSSTHEMIERFYSMKDAIKSVLATQAFDDSINLVALTDGDWVAIKELLDFFSIFVKTTTMMQGDTYPTLNRTLPEYLRLIKSLESVRDGKDAWNIKSPSIREAAIAALTKMNEYFAKNDSSPTAFVATMCDPRFKAAIFEHLWHNDSIYIKRAKIHFKETYQKYKDRDTRQRDYHTLNIEPETDQTDSEEDDLFKGYTGNPQSHSTEHDNWFSQATIDYKKGDIRAFWLSKGYDFKTIVQMARDHLSVPATSAASERVFSNGGDIITKRRNRLGGNNTRYLLCLRDWGLLVEDDDNGSDDDSFNVMEATEEALVNTV